MSAWPWIAAAEALAATVAAAKAYRRADQWKASARWWRRETYRFERLLVQEREANLLSRAARASWPVYEPSPWATYAGDAEKPETG